MESNFRKLPMSEQTSSCLQLVEHVGLEEAKGQNFAFSPCSIHLALSLLASGTSGRTLQELLGFLKSDSLDQVNAVGSQVIDSLDETKISSSGGPKLSFISGVWVENSCTLKPAFKEIVNSIYRAKAESVDFITKPLEEMEKVNKWVEKETNGLIQDLLPKGSITTDTRLVLANALYFKGSWDIQFNPSETKDSKFHLLDGSSVQVPFMTSMFEQFVSSYDGFKVLQLPYRQANYDPQRRFSMYIFLPDRPDGLADLIERVSSNSCFIDRHIPESRVQMREFRIPKFKITFGFEASRVLKYLGLELPFDDVKAELTEMVKYQNSGLLFVSEVYHKCSVEVDEIGTEAAASTAVIVMQQQLRRPIDFVADHPFMFIIRDNVNGMVLFMGNVINPLLN